MSRFNKVNELNAKQSGDLLGTVVYWSLSNCRVLVDDLKTLFNDAGLDPDGGFFPPKIVPSNAFQKAVKEAGRRHKGFMVRPIAKTTEQVVWGIVRETKDKANLKLDYKCNVQVRFVKATCKVDVHLEAGAEDQAKQIAQEIQAAYFELTQTFIGWDIQRMLTRNLTADLGAITLRRGGGFYFVLGQHLPTVLKHKRVVEQIGDCEVGILELRKGDKNSTDSIKRDARRSLEDEINTIKEEIKNFQAKTPRTDTLTRRVTEFKAIKQKVQVYADMLNIQVSDLTTGLDDCAQAVKALIGQVTVSSNEKAEAVKKVRAAARRESRAKEKAKVQAELEAPAETKDTPQVDEVMQKAIIKQEAEAQPKDKPKSIAEIKAQSRTRRKRNRRSASF